MRVPICVMHHENIAIIISQMSLVIIDHKNPTQFLKKGTMPKSGGFIIESPLTPLLYGDSNLGSL